MPSEYLYTVIQNNNWEYPECQKNISPLFAFVFGSKFNCVNDRVSQTLQKYGFKCTKSPNTTENLCTRKKDAIEHM